MSEFLDTLKQMLGVILALLSLGTAVGSAFVSRYKVKVQGEEIKSLKDECKSLKDEIVELEKTDNTMKEKIHGIEKSTESFNQDMQRQKELLTEIRIEVGGMTSELKSLNRLLVEIKDSKND